MRFVFLDSDQVLAATHLYFEELFGFIPQNSKDFWRHVNEYEVAGGRFFYEISPMPYANKLIAMARDSGLEVRILTATGNNFESVSEQKISWYLHNFRIPAEQIILVPHSEDKARVCKPGDILIDDDMRSIGPWCAAGGIGIQHRDFETTLREFEKVLGENTNDD
jgi:5'(3')-deoxyribonucleotidase